MDIRHEIRRLVPNGALGLLGIGGAEPAGEADLTVLFTDIDDYTGLTERLGDVEAHHLVRAHDRIVREALAASRGNEIKHTGDGIMACFASASRALEAAVAIQRGVRAWNTGKERAAPLAVAVGLNSGSPILEAGDLFGTAVNVAARVTDCAAGDQVLVTDVVRLLAAGKGYAFRPFATRQLDGMTEAVPLFEVVWQEGEPGDGGWTA